MTIQNEAWQQAVAALRDKYVGRIERYMELLDNLIESGASGEKIDKNTVEAIKCALRFWDASKEEKLSGIQRSKVKNVQDDTTPKMELKPADEERIRKLMG